MRNIFILIFLSLFVDSLHSQNVYAYSHLQEQTFEIEIPDSLYVVYGERIQSANHSYIDRDYTLFQYDILFTYHPGTCRIFEEFAGGTSMPKRINLESAIEVFFDQNFTQNFDLENQDELIVFKKYQINSKFGVIDLSEPKFVKLIFLDEYGDIITSNEFYDKKFYLHNLVKHLFKN